MLLWSVILIAISTLCIGFTAFIKNSSNKPNRLIFIFSVVVSVWIVSNYFSNSTGLSHNISKIMNHLTLLFGGGVVLTLNQLIETLGKTKPGRISKISYILGYLFIASSLTSLVVSDVKPGDSIVDIVFGPLSSVYFGALFYFIFRLFWITFRSIRRSSGIHKSRMQVIGIGVYGTFGILIVTNAVLPFFMNAFTASVVGPLVFILMVACLSYTIVRQHLFDIRMAIVRSTTYVITIAIVAVVYGRMIVFISERYLPESSARSVLMFVFVVVSLLSFEHLRRAIERLTANVLHRNRYDSQKVTNSIADVLVSNLDERQLINDTAQLLNTALKSSAIMYLQKNSQIIGLVGKHRDLDQTLILKNLSKLNTRVYVRPETPGTELDLALSDSKVDILIGFGQKRVFDGFLAFGPKANGAAYTSQDIDLLEIISKNTALALQNARRYREVSDFANVLNKEVKKATSELRLTNKSLRDVSETKDEFMSMVSHQLRPQLASSIGFIELLESKHDISKTDHDEFLKLARLSIGRMTRLVADILNAVSIQSGTFTLIQDKQDLIPMVESELKSAELSSKNAEVTVIFTKPKTPIYVYADDTKLREVIYNLIDNAIRYTPSGKNIKVSLDIVDGTARLEITDQGIGVDEKDKVNLFKKFYRASNAKEARPSGTGIGLFVAKNIIYAHKGKIIFSSTLGKGSTFGFTLPAYSE
jgi:signal transduction histidine kinase